MSAFDADASFAGTSAGAFAGSLRPEGTGPIPEVAPFMFNIEDVERKNLRRIDQSEDCCEVVSYFQLPIAPAASKVWLGVWPMSFLRLIERSRDYCFHT